MRLGLLVLVSCVLATSIPAAAQSPTQPSPQPSPQPAPQPAPQPSPASTPTTELEPAARAKQLFNLGLGFYRDRDYVAAAIMFAQAFKAFGRIARDKGGAVIDADAAELQRQALFFEISAHSLANHPVEAHDALLRYRDLVATLASCGVLRGQPSQVRCLPDDEIERNLQGFRERIGTLVVRGLQAGDIVFLDTLALDNVSEQMTLRVTAGDHVLDVRKSKHKPYVKTLRVDGNATLEHTVVLVPSDEPLRVRFVASVDAATVVVDGTARGLTPLELSLPPGKHRYRIAAKAHRAREGELVGAPGERVLVDATLVARRAPLGLRFDPYFIGSFYLRHDTPFEKRSAGVGTHVYSDYTRFGNLRFGFGIEYNARALAKAAIGTVATWCPDNMAGGGAAFCPISVDVQLAFGGEAKPQLETAPLATRIGSSLEIHVGNAFLRFAAGIGAVTYKSTLFSDTGDVKWLGAIHTEIAAGIDL